MAAEQSKGEDARRWAGLPPSLVPALEALPPPLDPCKHKGQAGRIAVVGGCTEYTGAPYFAAMSSLRVGADVVHVFCTRGAGPVIKSYSPELIVHPYLTESGEEKQDPTSSPEREEAMHASGAEHVCQWVPRMDAVVVGPGLGRDPQVLAQVATIIRSAREAEKVIILDADGLFLINSNLDLIQGYKKCVLTPNVIEFSRLVDSLERRGDVTFAPDEIKDLDSSSLLATVCNSLGGVTVVRKGPTDMIHNGEQTLTVSVEGSARRAGGQGDILAGTIAVFVSWSFEAIKSKRVKLDERMSIVMACYVACEIVRIACRKAFDGRRRSMVAGDVIEAIGSVMQEIFPAESINSEF
eukprot:CAMPEP_0196599372 /NCGR_PEP_ID=MMETSP1081-20130531/94823_1 /TAXON_ID=36882 /ORGANISM="Pyramimonas amylifera, Strain CCMP720" /LENGTH=352 /DNA_ID=CAMNT_0041925139 /DNA_START=180 /DNA_END=1238 /DNA_ORIENTATION=-